MLLILPPLPIIIELNPDSVVIFHHFNVIFPKPMGDLARLSRLVIDASGSAIVGVCGDATLAVFNVDASGTENRDLRMAARLGARFLHNFLLARAPGEQRQPCLVDHVERPNLTLSFGGPRIEDATGAFWRAL